MTKFIVLKVHRTFHFEGSVNNLIPKQQQGYAILVPQYLVKTLLPPTGMNK